jgi:DNA processing protein
LQNPDYSDRVMLWFLSELSSFGPSSVRKLKESVAHLADILSMDDLMLVTAGLNENQVSAIRGSSEKVKDIPEKMKQFEQLGIRFLIPEDKEWPARLSRIPDPPNGIFVYGMVPDDSTPAVSMIGSRNATNYGTRMSEFFSGEFARKGISVISGMAVGIDGSSQRGALKAGGKSFAVLGNGVNICYPKENYDIYRIMSEGKKGGIISEFPPGTPPLRYHFPARNRIIAALSDILIVVEAGGIKSGSQITINFALSQGKDIYAVPGRITDPLSRGCNDLLKNGAAVLTTPDDIYEAIGMIRERKLIVPEKKTADFNEEEKKIYGILGVEPHFVDDIVRLTSLPPGKVMSILLKLELDGFVVQTSGNYYAAVY